MLSNDCILLFGALAVATAAAVIDVQQHRIPNWLTFPAMGAGVLLRAYFFGWKGALTALGGLLLVGGIVFLFFAIRAMGAGDVKLLAAVGAIVGPQYGIQVLVVTGIAGGVMAIFYALFRGQLRRTLVNVGSVMKYHATAGIQAHPELNLDNPQTLRLPYGLAIAAGTLYTFVVTYWR